MYKFQNIENLGTYLYDDRLPKHYLIEDKAEDVQFALKKYFTSIGEGGFNPLITLIVNFMDILDPIKCPDSLFPMLFANFGLPYFQDIPMDFHRKLLINIGDLYMRKGTRGVIEYLAREVTGLEVTTIEGTSQLFRTWSDNPHKEIQGYTEPKTWSFNTKTTYILGKEHNYGSVSIILALMNDWEDNDDYILSLKEEVFERFLWYFMPFDIGYSIRKITRDSESCHLDTDEYWYTDRHCTKDEEVFINNTFNDYSRLNNMIYTLNNENGLITNPFIEVLSQRIKEEFISDRVIYVKADEYDEAYYIYRNDGYSVLNNILYATNSTLYTNADVFDKTIYTYDEDSFNDILEGEFTEIAIRKGLLTDKNSLLSSTFILS